VVHRSYRIGEDVVGIRTTSEAFGSWMDRVLKKYATSEEASPNFSVVVSGGDEGSGSDRRFHILYGGTLRLVRTLDLPTLGRSLIAELERLQSPQHEDAVYLDATIVTLDGVRILLPSFSTLSLNTEGRRLERAGGQLSLGRTTAVDERSGQVIPPAPMLEIPRRAIDELEAPSAGNGHTSRTVLDRAVSVDIVAVPGPGEVNTVQRISRAQALANVGTLTLNLPRKGRSGLNGLLRLVQGADCYSLAATDGRGLLGCLTEIVKA
jgi:hypothetical protein